jgi:hypothetical protein
VRRVLRDLSATNVTTAAVATAVPVK